MMTTLFSVTFTSCIDNEVSPLVEAIYGAQADLIAAQAAVQNAEATKLEAEAAHELALAAFENANAAYTLEEVEELRIANAKAQLELDEAQAEFNITMVGLLAELEEAGAQIALDYAIKYRTYANAATNLLDDKADAVYDLAEAQAQLNSSAPLFALEGLQMQVANAKLQVELEQAKIAELQALIDDPTSLPAQVTAWQAELDELEIAIDAKQAEIEAKYAERDNLIAGWDGVDDVRDNFVQEYDDQAQKVIDLSADIEVQQDIVDAKTLALATYAADLTAAGTALTAAELAYNNAWTALGKKDSQGVDVVYPNYFTWSAKTSAPEAIAAGATKYATPANLQQVYVNARIDVLDATADLAAYQADFDDLTLSYNNAADALSAAQAAFDAQDYVGASTAANLALSTYQTGGFAAAQLLYTTTLAAWDANKNGTVYTDTAVDSWDLGKVGVHTDDDNLDTPYGVTGAANTTQTYYRVATWSQPIPGSYVPATFAATAYTAATLASYKAALEVANGANTIQFVDDVTVAINAADYADTQLAETADGKNIYFVEVEADDTHNDPILNNGNGGNLDTFNNATNALGTEITDAFYTGTTTRIYATDNMSGTAYATLWNLQKAASEAAWNVVIGDDVLVAAQDAFDYQQELFDNGVANLALLADDLTVATGAQTAAKKAVDNAWATLGTEYTAGLAGDLPKWWVAKTGYVIDATSGYDSDYTAPLVSNTLTLNAVVYNAEIAKANLVACNAVCLQDAIDTAQHEIDLIQPSLDLAIALVAQMQAQYDIYMETYIPGSSIDYDNLDADLKVLYDTLSFEIFKLNQELNALDAEYDAIDDILDNINDDNLSDISLQIATALTSITGDYQEALLALEAAETALATAMADSADDAAYIAYLQSKVDVLEQRYQNALALAAKYKALMEAALAS